MFDEEWNFEHQRVFDFIRHFVYDNIDNLIVHEIHARTLNLYMLLNQGATNYMF